jgi:DNA-binding GntR family transcriptional regulator
VQIRRASFLPLHEQIRAAILSEIEEGRLSPGDRLPTEHELADRMGVSIAPVRQALLSLANSGNITRIKGRGTFVRSPAVHSEIALVKSITESLRAAGFPFRIEVMRQGVEPAAPDVASKLGLPHGAEVVALVRRVLIEAEPGALVESYLPAERFGRLARIEGFADGRSLYRTLADEFDTRTRSATSVLRVVRCDQAQSEALDLRMGEPALLVSSVTEDLDGVTMEVARVLYRTDLFSFTVNGLEEATGSPG